MPQVIPATMKPAGMANMPAPIDVISIKQNIKKFAVKLRFGRKRLMKARIFSRNVFSPPKRCTTTH